MAIAAPFIGKMQVVKDQWTDYNGHLNMAYYTVLFDRAADELIDALGMGADYIKRTNCSIFTLETHTSYANELHAGDQVRIETRLIAADQKRVHYVQQMFREDTQYLACVLEVMVSHVDLTTRRTAPWPPEALALINTALAAHKSLPLPPQVGHQIGLPPPRN